MPICMDSRANISIPNSHQDNSSVAACDILVKLFLLFLPFSQVLTIDVLFPLKLSEIFLIIILLIKLTTGEITRWMLPKPTAWVLIIFVSIVLISLILNAFWGYSYPFDQNIARFSPLVDSVLKFFYIIIALLALVVTYNALKKDASIINFFYWGGIISASYGWYLFIFGALKLPTPLLPGTYELAKYNAGFGDIIRGATFKEGNYMSLYLLVLAIISFYNKKNKLAYFFFLSIITTFSSTAIACSIVFFVIIIFNKYKKHKLKLLVTLFSVIITLVLLIQFSTGFRGVFYNKIFGTEDSVENQNDLYSKAERLNTAAVGIEVSKNNPFWGVGPANYGLHYRHYNTISAFDIEGKHIPNNIYVEVLSECGGLAFITFLFFLFGIYRYGKRKSQILAAGLISVYIYFFAFPTFTMLFIWVFLGIVLV